MFAFFGVYWSTHGWKLALGLVVSIYIHEMGHVAMLRRLGIKAGSPLFIPGVGALVMLKQRIDDPIIDAKIGLAGPIWGLGAGLAAYGIFVMTKVPVWLAIAQLTGLINLFNLIPIWQLDGSRAFHALSSAQRIVLLCVIALTYFATQQKMLLLIGAVAVWRAFQKTTVPGDRDTVLKFSLLVAALSWLAVDF
jgi:Zn-dependent protease